AATRPAAPATTRRATGSGASRCAAGVATRRPRLHPVGLAVRPVHYPDRAAARLAEPAPAAPPSHRRRAPGAAPASRC
ncbi:hypothetical protein ABTF01_22520, partial [Acinetobacter baumannii]